MITKYWILQKLGRAGSATGLGLGTTIFRMNRTTDSPFVYVFNCQVKK